MVADYIMQCVGQSLKRTRNRLLMSDKTVLAYIHCETIPWLIKELEKHPEVLRCVRGTDETAEIHTTEGTYRIQYTRDPSCAVSYPNGHVVVCEFPKGVDMPPLLQRRFYK